MSTLVRLDLKKPHQKYVAKSGKEVPGVTTVLRVYDKPALLAWYGREERAGILRFMRKGNPDKNGFPEWDADALEDALPKTKDGEPKLFAVAKRDTAGDVGTIAHAMIEASLQGAALSPDGLDPKLYKQALNPYQRFMAWFHEKPRRVVATELRMVSESYQCGGTGDLFCEDHDGVMSYVDVKTGGAWYDGFPYDEQFAQSSAYAAFFDEQTADISKKVVRIYIARVGKTADDPGDIYLMDAEQRAIGLRMFARAVEHYNDRYTMKCHNTERRSMEGFTA